MHVHVYACTTHTILYMYELHHNHNIWTSVTTSSLLCMCVRAWQIYVRMYIVDCYIAKGLEVADSLWCVEGIFCSFFCMSVCTYICPYLLDVWETLPTHYVSEFCHMHRVGSCWFIVVCWGDFYYSLFCVPVCINLVYCVWDASLTYVDYVSESCHEGWHIGTSQIL